MANPSYSKPQKKPTIQPLQKHSEDGQLDDLMDDMPTSQQSMTSSDAGIMAAVAQQMQASSEKKKKEKAKKFLQLARREFDRCITKKGETLSKNVEDMTVLFETFVLAHASCDDEIRKLWVSIGEEQKMLLDLAIRRHALATSQSQELEKGQLGGMASVRRACEDFKTVVDELTLNVC